MMDEPASAGEHLALRIMQCGVVAVVLAATTYTAFDLDRFFVPKEFVLHAAVVLAALAGVHTFARVAMTRVDKLLLLYLLVSAASALLATNRWLALRALAISASSLLLFWLARGLSAAGLSRRLLGALSAAVVIAAMTSLLQTYGLQTLLFSENRAPGGTLGNRNFIAHVAAFGLPLVFLSAMRALRGIAFITRAAGVAIVTASLVLTRSRAAWLAFGAVLLVICASILISKVLRRDVRTWKRLGEILVLTGIAVGLVLVMPNTLRWRGRDPYLQSMRRVADYQGGSGHGRLVQYTQSLRMAAHHPLLGVGPGNWPVEYPAYAIRNDPSMNESEGGMTSNPWPSSDWVAFLSERGLASMLLLGFALLGIALAGIRQLRLAQDTEEAHLAVALLATVAGAAITGLFDAVLLLAVPSFLVWTAIGALWKPLVPTDQRPSALIVAAIVIISAVGAARSAMQIMAMNTYTTHGDRAALARAAKIDPGNYRLQLRLARNGGRERCAHARAAHALFPHAEEAIALARLSCR